MKVFSQRTQGPRRFARRGMLGLVAWLGCLLFTIPAMAESNTWSSYAHWSGGRRSNVLLNSNGSIKLPYKEPTKRTIETPFIYVPNTSRNTVVKMRTDTGAIIWTYQLGPLNAGSQPSRTTVDANGNVWTGLRAGNYVVVITPEGKLVQKINIGAYGPRAVTIDKNGDLWVGAMQGRTLVKIVYDNTLKQYKIVHRISAPNFCPYGAATDTDGNIWVVNSFWHNNCYPGVTKVNGTTGQIIQWVPAKGAYGISADRVGNVWVSSYTDSKAYQIRGRDGVVIRTYDTGHRGRGVSIDPQGKVWIACSTNRSGSGNVRHTVKIDPVTRTLYSYNHVGAHSIGIAADQKGNVWVNSYSEGLSYKLNSITGALLSTHPVCDTTGLKPCLCGDGRACPTSCKCGAPSQSGPYTYSDMTGFQLQLNLEPAQGTWQGTFDACCSAIFSNATANIDTPPGTEVLVRARTAVSVASLNSAIWGPYVKLGQPLQVKPNRSVEVQLLLKTRDSRKTPIVSDVTVHYSYFNACTVKKVNGICKDLCPTTCRTDFDCDPYRCGVRTKCIKGQCVDPTFKGTCQPPNLLMVVDRSCSMGAYVDSGSPCTDVNDCNDWLRSSSYRRCQTGTSTGSNTCHYTRWDTAMRALMRVVNDYGGTAAATYNDRRVRFGFATFDSSAALQEPLYTNPDKLTAKMKSLVWGGGTNYSRGLKLAYDHIDTVMKTDPIALRANAVLFLTDGYPGDGCTTPKTHIRNLYNMPNGKGGARKIKTYIVGFGSGLNSGAQNCLNELAKEGKTDRAPTCTTGSCLRYYAADSAASLAEAFQDIINNATGEVCDGLDNDCDGIVDNTTEEGGCLCSKSFAKPAPTTLINPASVDYTANTVRLYTFMANATNQGYCKGLPKIGKYTAAHVWNEVCRNNQRKALGCAGGISNPAGDAFQTYCGRCCGTNTSKVCYWSSDHACKKTPWTATTASTCYSKCTNFCKANKKLAINCIAPRGQLIRSGSGYNATNQLTVKTAPAFLGEWLSFQRQRHLFVNLPNTDFRPMGTTTSGYLIANLTPNNYSLPSSVSGSIYSGAYNFRPTNSALTHEMLGIKTSECGSATECARERTETIDFIRGYDDNGKMTRRLRLGPIYHSSPQVVGPPEENNPDPQYQQWRLSTVNGGLVSARPPVVYVASNDGVMHAFLVNAPVTGRPAEAALTNLMQNGNTGNKLVELWGFIPKTVLHKLRAGVNGSRPDGGRLYGLDGTPVVKNVQMYRYAVGSTVYAKWRTVMVFGMGAAGRGYVAIDVTNPYKPRLLWEINHNSLKDKSNVALGKFSRLGYTTAKPLIANLLVNWGGRLQERAVAVLSGGMPILERNSPPHYMLNRTDSTVGNVVYIVDLETGRLIRELIPPAPRLPTPSFAVSGISGTPVGFGILPALTTRIFVGDVRGRIFRIDTQSNSPGSWRMRLFHDLYDNSSITTSAQAAAIIRRPIMNAPAVALNSRGEVVLLGGTGDVLNFDLIGGTNKVFSLRENLNLNSAADPINGTLLDSQVVAVSNYVADLNKNVTMSSTGLPAAQSNATQVTGERVTGDPVIYNGTAYFTTYTPSNNLPICGVPGFGRIYGIHFDDVCRTDSCWSGLLKKGLLAAAVTPIRCCEKGGGLGGTCDSTNKVPWDDSQKRALLVSTGSGYCNDLNFTVPRMVDPVVPPQYYRFRMLGENTLAMGPSFTYHPGETTLQRVNAADASKGHRVKLNAQRSGRYFITLQVSGRHQASNQTHRLQRMQVMRPTADKVRKAGNMFTMNVTQDIPSIFVSSWSAVLD